MVAARDADEREADACVSSGRFDDGRALFEYAAPLGVENHSERGTIFHRPAGVHVFELCEYRAERRRRKTSEVQKRSAADQIEHAFSGDERRLTFFGTLRV